MGGPFGLWFDAELKPGKAGGKIKRQALEQIRASQVALAAGMNYRDSLLVCERSQGDRVSETGKLSP